MERSQSPLAACSSTGPLERRSHVDGDGFYTVVGESLKYDLEAQCGWGQQRLRRMKVRKAVHYFVYADKGTTDSSMD